MKKIIFSIMLIFATNCFAVTAINISPADACSTAWNNGATLASTAVQPGDANFFSVYTEGTPYSLTTSPAMLDFGTTDPNLSITRAGNYMIWASVTLDYNSTTYALNEQALFKLHRNNNTPSDIDDSNQVRTLGIVTLCKTGIGGVALPPVFYTTENTDDQIQLYGYLSAATDAGTVDVNSASIIAVRLP